MSVKRDTRKVFQILEIIWKNLLANEVVRYFSNLIAKGCWTQSIIWGEWLTLTHQSTCHGSIYKIGNARKHFFGVQGIRVGLSLSLIVCF